MAAALLAAVGGGCAEDGPAPDPPPPRPEPATVLFRGEARLDGAPVDADFLGAAVLEDGLATPCQAELPPVAKGRYAIRVHSSAGGLGCGAPGAKVVLWAFVGDRTLWSDAMIDWPADGDAAVDADVDFATANPSGAAPEVAQFSGTVFDGDGGVAPVGTEVEAFVGDERCGVASVRRSDTFVGYVISVVGPESVAGCERGAIIDVRVEGESYDHNPIVNTPPGERDPIDLRPRRG